ncbi:MFS transporter [Kibdelosporangium philippinense]|uniref:MFS transporter n=1 Tax=Kibdelosporangium philippinense TaxID=211113 RepID=UPI00361C8744
MRQTISPSWWLTRSRCEAVHRPATAANTSVPSTVDSSAISAVGGSFSLVAIPTQLFTLTGSSAAIGLSAVISTAALVVSALWSGALADVMDCRRLLLIGNAGLGLTYVGLWLNPGSVPVLLALVALHGISFGATMTTTGTAVPFVVPAEQLVAANSLNALTRYTGAAVGPLIAGLLIPIVGLSTLYLLDALALIIVLWAVAKLPAMPRRGQRVQLGEGFRYLARDRVWSRFSPWIWLPWFSRCRSHFFLSWPSRRTAARPVVGWN